MPGRKMKFNPKKAILNATYTAQEIRDSLGILLGLSRLRQLKLSMQHPPMNPQLPPSEVPVEEEIAPRAPPSRQQKPKPQEVEAPPVQEPEFRSPQMPLLDLFGSGARPIRQGMAAVLQRVSAAAQHPPPKKEGKTEDVEEFQRGDSGEVKGMSIVT